MSGALTITIPGEPCAQGRPRATNMAGHIHIYDPPASRSWKGAARYQMAMALEGNGSRPDCILTGCAVGVVVRAFHTCPKSDYRKRKPQPLRWRSKRPDCDQIVKAVLDAATSVLWADDAQVARLLIEQYTAAQGEAPRIELEVRPLSERGPHESRDRAGTDPSHGGDNYGDNLEAANCK